MKQTVLSLVLGAVLATCAGSAALAAEARSPLPPFGEPKPFTLPKVESYSLRNGLKVTLVPFGSVPKSYNFV